jgi:hypothetical protein
MSPEEAEIITGVLKEACAQKDNEIAALKAEIERWSSKDWLEYHKTELTQKDQEIERLKAALNKIASWPEGDKVTPRFDEPCSAAEARTALKAK